MNKALIIYESWISVLLNFINYVVFIQFQSLLINIISKLHNKPNALIFGILFMLLL